MNPLQRAVWAKKHVQTGSVFDSREVFADGAEAFQTRTLEVLDIIRITAEIEQLPLIDKIIETVKTLKP